MPNEQVNSILGWQDFELAPPQELTDEQKRGKLLLDMVLGPGYEAPADPQDAAEAAHEKLWVYYDTRYGEIYKGAAQIMRSNGGNFPQQEIDKALAELKEERQLAFGEIERRYYS